MFCIGRGCVKSLATREVIVTSHFAEEQVDIKPPIYGGSSGDLWSNVDL